MSYPSSLHPFFLDLKSNYDRMSLIAGHSDSFDSELWKRGEKKRGYLVRHILKSRMVLGNTKEEIKQMFGQEGNYFPFDRWTYSLGRGLLGTRYLVFYFDENKVSRIKIELSK